MALPWGGSEVAESAPDQIALLFSAAEAYVVGRPRKHQPGLQPFLHASEADDPAAQSDSGGASFLDAVRLFLIPCPLLKGYCMLWCQSAFSYVQGSGGMIVVAGAQYFLHSLHQAVQGAKPSAPQLLHRLSCNCWPQVDRYAAA